MTKERPPTTPHDYRVVCEFEPHPTVVGGQAVNIWALFYLSADVPAADLVSKDLDVIVEPDGLVHFRRVPGWVFEPNKTKSWTDSRLGFLKSTSPDGRPLLVEVLHSAHGLDKADLAAASYVQVLGATYRVLDPVAMLKAKIANVRDIDQATRQDRQHLHLIARCVPMFLREVHDAAAADSAKEKAALKVITRAFKLLQRPRFTNTLFQEGIAPHSLLPEELARSPLARMRKACVWQMKLIPAAPRVGAKKTKQSGQK